MAGRASQDRVWLREKVAPGSPAVHGAPR